MAIADDIVAASSFTIVDNPPYNGNLRHALQSATPGSVLWCGTSQPYDITGLYVSPTHTDGDPITNTIENLTIVGMGMPRLADDKSRFITGSGTIIQGLIMNKAKGFHIENLGIDCGNYVSQNVFPSVTYEDCLHIYDAGDNANIYINNIKTLNSVGISSKPGTHSILIERTGGVYKGYVECIGGYHGLTLKGWNITGGWSHCYAQYGDGFILKSDSGTKCRDIHLDGIRVGLIDNTGWPDVSIGGIYDPHDGQTIDRVTIGELAVQGAAWGLGPAGSSDGYTTNINIGIFSAVEVYGNYYALEINERCVGWTIGQHAISAASGGIRVHKNSAYIDIGHGYSKNNTRSGYSLGGNTLSHGRLVANENGEYGVEYTGGYGFNKDDVTAYGNTLGNFSDLPSAIQGNFLNGWTAGKNFRAVVCGHRVFISGKLIKGTAGPAFVIPNALLPKEDVPVHGTGVNPGANAIPVQAWVRSAKSDTNPCMFDVYGFASTASYIDFNCSYDIA
ncbi:phage tail protein [Kosakonia sp. H7A]|nr:phage tail protein [Kosakonia sp. H7A]